MAGAYILSDNELLQKHIQHESEMLLDPKIKSFGFLPAPSWAPNFLREAYSMALARLIDSSDVAIAEYSMWAQLHHRLMIYPGIQSAWKTVMNGPIKGRPELQSATSERIGAHFLYGALLESHEDFCLLPKQKKTARNKKLVRAAELCEELTKLIESDGNIFRLLNSSVLGYFGDRASALSRERGFDIPEHSITYPYDYALLHLPEIFGCEDSKVSRNAKTDAARAMFTWLLIEINCAGLNKILPLASNRMRQACLRSVEIAQPGRADKGYLPYMIGKISTYMKSLHGQPFDDAVAIFASAMANLDSPLGRDDVRGRARDKTVMKKKGVSPVT